MRYFIHIPILLLWFASFLPGPLSGALGRKPATAGACTITGTYTDCFTSLANPLANPPYQTGAAACGGSWYVTVRSTGTGAIPTIAARSACAIYTGGTFGANQTTRFMMNTTGFAGVSGPCIHANIGGNMYCYLINLQEVWVVTGGGGINPVVSGCPSTSGADSHVWRVSNVGNTITCADETSGASSSGTDSTYTGSGGYGGFIIDEGAGGTGTQAVTQLGMS